MELTITEEKPNPYLKRKEVQGKITFEKATPSNVDVRKKISEKTKADEELIVMKHIYTQFGSQKAKFLAYIYETKEIKDRIEPKKKEKKKEDK